MKPVSRSEILDLGAYEQIRDRFRARVIEEKKARRARIGSNMSVLFENHDTALFQIQEMLRTERISAEKAVLHEIETYNELVPGDSELSATIFVEYDDRAEREAMLEKLAGLEDKFYVLVEGERQKVVPDARNDRRDRTTAVHYVKFPLSPAAVRAIREKKPVRIGVDHPAYTAENELSPATVAALAEDLSG
ncbi:MAG: DUF3501 family protein [Polyangiaceae bacterium]|nr:DUF3501 family protein [Polyangiaceae bacterium]MCE7890923.1 DUF3501 family protein [Sorangiineae bacterium PRO1]MCL4756260.1 DUF3501 family protein [Myxococcales bacterium]